MGKTRQRRESAYHLGKQDARSGRHFRWAKHPQMGAYKRGYRDGGGNVPGDRIKWRGKLWWLHKWALLYNWWKRLRGSCVSKHIPKYHR